MKKKKLLKTLSKFFEGIGYEGWKADVLSVIARGGKTDGEHYLGTKQFKLLHAAYLEARFDRCEELRQSLQELE